MAFILNPLEHHPSFHLLVSLFPIFLCHSICTSHSKFAIGSPGPNQGIFRKVGANWNSQNKTSTSWGRKIFFTIATFQPFLYVFMRLETISTSMCESLGLTTLKDFGVGSHLSFQMCTCFPFPMVHLELLTMISLIAIILIHA